VTLPGVVFIDHTADVGIDVRAASFEELLHRAAMGMLALLRGEEEQQDDADAGGGGAPKPGGGGGHRRGPGDEGGVLEPIPVSIRAPGHARLVADWLSEILFLHEVRGVDYVASALTRAGPEHLEGRVLVRAGGRAVREIKGVTYHDLEVSRGAAGEWSARVIFDV
jgi:SHS2 domain-containing protein